MKRKSAEEDEVSKIDAQSKSKRPRITVADETISEENKKLQIALHQKCISRSEIQNAQSQIEMGFQKKQTLECGISELKDKRNSITKRRKISNTRDSVELKQLLSFVK